MNYTTLMKQSEYAQAREIAKVLNEAIRKEFKSELRGVKRYVDPRVKGVSTKYIDVDGPLADRLVKFINKLPIPVGAYKISAERVYGNSLYTGGYNSVRLSVKAA